MTLGALAKFVEAKPIRTGLLLLVMNIAPIVLPALALIVFAYITLRQGARAGLFLLPWALLPYLAHAVEYHAPFVFLVPGMAWLATLLGALLLRQYSSWVPVLQLYAVLGVVAVAFAHGYASDITGWWLALIQQYSQDILRESAGQASAEVGVPAMIFLAKIATGAQVVLLTIKVVTQLMVARWWQASLFNPGGLRKELHLIAMPRAMFFLFAIIVAGIGVKMPVAIDALSPVLLAYVIAGLSLLHAWVAHYKYSMMLLVSFYVAATLLYYIFFMVVLAAIADSWLHFRFKKSKTQTQ
jgi:hypothetical protein